jgi:amino acid transporter
MTCLGLGCGLVLNISNRTIHRSYFRFATFIFLALFLVHFIAFLLQSWKHGTLDLKSSFENHNGVNKDQSHHLPDWYPWLVVALYPFCVFFGFDSNVHTSEETMQASKNVPRAMCFSTTSAFLASTAMIWAIIAAMPDMAAMYNGPYENNWAMYVKKLLGTAGAVIILISLWVAGTCAASSCFMSAQRLTYALARDGFLFKWFTPIENNLPKRSGYLIFCISVLLSTASMHRTLALQILGVSAAFATNISYIVPIILRHICSPKFEQGTFRLGCLRILCTYFSMGYFGFSVIVFMIPHTWPVTASDANYGSWCVVPVMGILYYFSWFWLPYIKRNENGKLELQGWGAKLWFFKEQETRGQSRVEEVTLNELRRDSTTPETTDVDPISADPKRSEDTALSEATLVRNEELS